MSGHIINDFKDLRSLIGDITKANPAKTTRQQNEKKMGVHKEAPEAEPKDDKGDRGIARSLGKKHAGEEEIKKAYLKLGRAAQGSVEYQRKLVQKQLAKMGYKTYSKMAFDDLFNVENAQQAKREQEFKDTASQFQLESALSDMQNIVKTKGAKKINGVMVDMFTASVITKAYDKVSDANKKKMEGANLQTLVKLAHKIMGMREELGLDESKMGDLLIDIQMGATAKELARDHNISIQMAKNFLSDYYGNKPTRKAPGLKKEYVVLDTGLEKALKKFKVKFSKDLKNIDEGGMKRLFTDLEQGATAQQISKKYGIDMKTAKSFVDDYKKVSQAPRLRAAQNDPMKEGKYAKYSDLLLGKSRAIDKYGPDSKVVQAINRDIKKEMDRLGIKEENIQEGTWAVPDSKAKLKRINHEFLNGQKRAGSLAKVKKYARAVDTLFGDDSFSDDMYVLEILIDNEKDARKKWGEGTAGNVYSRAKQKIELNKDMDMRDILVNHLGQWVEIKNYKITKAPAEWVESVSEIKLKEKGNIKKPKGKMVPLTMSKEDKLKEEKEQAQESPFKLKSQQYPRAVAINTDGFGHRHATVEDIIAACDSFGMILDKELQVEQIQKQLGKKGFISFKQTDLNDVFEERETQRIILALESTVEEQEPIEYTKNEITEAYIMGEEIEFIKPDGYKTAGPVLKKGGNTFNVKDKFTGKSYTYKYVNEEKEETKVKTFKEASSINEGRFSKQLIKQAGGIAFDKRYYMGNMSGAVKAIEKLKKGLSDDPKVKEMLRIANEGNLSNMDEYIKADGTRKRVNASDKRLKGNNSKLKEGDKEAYQKFFNKALKKFGVSSPDELEGDKKKEFFNYVDKNWKGDHEEVKPSDLKIDGRRKNFKEKMRKLGYIKGN